MGWLSGQQSRSELIADLIRPQERFRVGNLARNLFRYLVEDAAMESYEATRHLSNRELAVQAATTRAECKIASHRRTAELRAANEQAA